jgi:hypothetical protein
MLTSSYQVSSCGKRIGPGGCRSAWGRTCRAVVSSYWASISDRIYIWLRGTKCLPSTASGRLPGLMGRSAWAVLVSAPPSAGPWTVAGRKDSAGGDPVGVRVVRPLSSVAVS